MTSYPVEKYIELENNPYLLGRIIITQVKESFHAEIDIVHKESHKIFKHIGIIYNEYSGEEALITGIQRMRQFLEAIEKEQETQESKNNNLH